ncbi:MAG: hypothetical protein ACJ71S_05320 [Acidobacteriaceae bacterium]
MAQVSVGRDCELELEAAAGSSVWCATQAQDATEFAKKIDEILDFYGLHIIVLEAVGQFENCDAPSAELAGIAQRAAQDPNFALYGTFHTYPYHSA